MVNERDDWQAMAADPRWQWQEGMRDLGGLRVLSVCGEGFRHPIEVAKGCIHTWKAADEMDEPDRTDRPTVGAVQGMAEAWCEARGYGWAWSLDGDTRAFEVVKPDPQRWDAVEFGPDLATVAARALMWCWAQEVGDG